MNKWQRAVCGVAALILAAVFLWFAGQPAATWRELVGMAGAIAGIAVAIWFGLWQEDSD
jgi:hypothetical protein